MNVDDYETWVEAEYSNTLNAFDVSTPRTSRCDVDDGVSGARRLTPTECERLQGFPDGWTDNCNDTARYTQLGNAVTVPVIEWIGRRLVAA